MKVSAVSALTFYIIVELSPFVKIKLEKLIKKVKKTIDTGKITCYNSFTRTEIHIVVKEFEMKKLIFRSLTAVMSLVVSASFLAGCTGGAQTGENILNIAIYRGGYGERWANNLAQDFMAENPGVTVNVDADKDLVGNIPRYLEDGSEYDIFFSHGIEWEVSARMGWLEPLDDLYAMEVEDGLTVEDRVLDRFLPSSKFRGQGDTEERYYKLHWTNGVGGIVYNKKMFDDNGWEVPTTYQELVDLCNQITDAKIPSPGNPDEYVRPFVFSKEDYYWDYLVFDWMVQLCGTEELDKMLQLSSPEVFNPGTSEVVKAQKEALSRWTDLIAKQSKNSMVNSIGKPYDIAQADFINGNAAMMPNAQWLENEMLANIDENVCVMAMMPTPALPGAKTDGSGQPIRYSRAVGGDDSIVIPAKAPNKDLAKKFLAFMCREENAIKFTENTHGVMLGLDYDIDALNSIENSTEFMKSVFEINTNSVKYDTYSSSVLRLDGRIKCEWFTTTGFAPYPDIIQNPDTDLDKIFSDYYSYVKSNWTSWGGPAV